MTDKVSYFGKEAIQPDFLKSQKSSRTAAAKKNLAELENEAVKKSPLDTSNASEAEKNIPYTGSGRKPAQKKQFGAKKSPLKRGLKALPSLLIVGIVIGAIFFMFSSATMLGSQIETLVTRATDTAFGSYSENTLRITKELLAGQRGNFPKNFEKRLNARNIEVKKSGTGYALEYNGNTITASNFDDFFKNDIDFREAFTTAKRGRTSNFFDISAGMFYARLTISRNLFRNYRQTGNSDTDTAAYRSTESDVFAGGTDTSLNTVIEKEVLDENGNPVLDKNGNKVYKKVAAGGDVSSSGAGSEAPKVRAASYLADIANRVSAAGGIGCAALKVGNLISVAISVNEIYQAIKYFSSNQENISKTLGGDGEYAAMNSFLNHISEVKTTTYIDAESGEEKEVTGSALEAEGFANALAGEKANVKKTKNYSISSAFITTGVAIGMTAANTKFCGGIRVAGAVISLISFAASGAMFKSVITLAKSFILSAVVGGAISAMLSVLIPHIAKALFTNTFEDLEGIPAGETLVKGADLMNKKNGRSSSGQLLATKEIATAYNKYTVAAAHSEAEIDRANRSPFDATSPNTFLGSFVGKFATITGSTNFLSLIRSTASVVKNSANSIASSFTGSAYANDLSNISLSTDTSLSGTDFQTIFSADTTCDNLTEIGAVCDMYGAEIVATHPDVINVDSNDPKYQTIVNRNVTRNAEGHYEVIKKSLLSKKVKYCDERDSPFGVLDANIINDFRVNLGILEYVPALGDVLDIVNATMEASDEAIGWARGTYCVMNPETNPYYEDLIYLQHFEEDLRIASQLQLDEVTDAEGNDVNPITAFKENYFKENPIDTSEAGLLAHYTGSTKADAELALALIDYVAFLETYDAPDEEPATDGILNLAFKKENRTEVPDLTQTSIKLLSRVEYDSIRSKSYAA